MRTTNQNQTEKARKKTQAARDQPLKFRLELIPPEPRSTNQVPPREKQNHIPAPTSEPKQTLDRYWLR